MGPVALCLAACGSELPITVHFEAQLGGEAIRCDAPLEGLGTSTASLELAGLRLFVSRSHLLGPPNPRLPRLGRLSHALLLHADRMAQDETTALLDLDPCRGGRTMLEGWLDDRGGGHTSLAFSVGSNAGEGTKLAEQDDPFDQPEMFDAQRERYLNLRLDARDSGGTPYALHLKPSQCGPDPLVEGGQYCPRYNGFNVELPIGPPDDDRRLEFTVAMDLDVLFAGSDLSRNSPGTAEGCVSDDDDPDCVPVFKALGMDPDGHVQSVFRLD